MVSFKTRSFEWPQQHFPVVQNQDLRVYLLPPFGIYIIVLYIDTDYVLMIILTLNRWGELTPYMAKTGPTMLVFKVHSFLVHNLKVLNKHIELVNIEADIRLLLLPFFLS